MIELPKKSIAPERVNPKKILIYSKPKAGKTSIVAQLPKCLLLDFENGSDFVSGLKLKVNSLQELKEIGDAIKANNYPYEYGALDTITALEDMVLPYAAKLYSDTPMGKNWIGNDVRQLPQGSGYLYLRQAFFNILNEVNTWFPNLILLAHLKEKLIEKKGEEVAALDLDLTGKIRSIVTASVDAIAYLYRKENQTILNFNTSEEVICGARSPHLRNREIVIAESNANDNIKTYWDKVYV
jgi:hypothetical protein